MGMYSFFQYEDNVELYDEPFYEWLKSIQHKNGEAKEIVEWYEDNRDKKTKKLPKFTFEIFNEWKIQGYWYDDFVDIIVNMGKFLRPVEDEDYGSAYFEYEEGQPFKFILDYKKRKISVEYVPIIWEGMKLNSKLKVPIKILNKVDELFVEERI